MIRRVTALLAWILLPSLGLAEDSVEPAAAAAADTPTEATEPLAPAAPLPNLFGKVEVDTAKTSIYIGAVTLKMPPFVREGDTFRSTYKARVFPFFFYNEDGRIAITLSDGDLRKLVPGQRVYFTGEAFSTADEPRRVEGQAEAIDLESGKIKVRVWVSKKIELIFNTTYRFTGP